jgi:hypothetical protein
MRISTTPSSGSSYFISTSSFHDALSLTSTSSPPCIHQLKFTPNFTCTTHSYSPHHPCSRSSCAPKVSQGYGGIVRIVIRRSPSNLMSVSVPCPRTINVEIMRLESSFPLLDLQGHYPTPISSLHTLHHPTLLPLRPAPAAISDLSCPEVDSSYSISSAPVPSPSIWAITAVTSV